MNGKGARGGWEVFKKNKINTHSDMSWQEKEKSIWEVMTSRITEPWECKRTFDVCHNSLGAYQMICKAFSHASMRACTHKHLLHASSILRLFFVKTKKKAIFHQSSTPGCLTTEVHLTGTFPRDCQSHTTLHINLKKPLPKAFWGAN